MNQRPLRPQRSAHTKLSYTPTQKSFYNRYNYKSSAVRCYSRLSLAIPGNLLCIWVTVKYIDYLTAAPIAVAQIIFGVQGPNSFINQVFVNQAGNPDL